MKQFTWPLCYLPTWKLGNHQPQSQELLGKLREDSGRALIPTISSLYARSVTRKTAARPWKQYPHLGQPRGRNCTSATILSCTWTQSSWIWVQSQSSYLCWWELRAAFLRIRKRWRECWSEESISFRGRFCWVPKQALARRLQWGIATPGSYTTLPVQTAVLVRLVPRWQRHQKWLGTWDTSMGCRGEVPRCHRCFRCYLASTSTPQGWLHQIRVFPPAETKGNATEIETVRAIPEY